MIGTITVKSFKVKRQLVKENRRSRLWQLTKGSNGFVRKWCGDIELHHNGSRPVSIDIFITARKFGRVVKRIKRSRLLKPYSTTKMSFKVKEPEDTHVTWEIDDIHVYSVDY